MAPGPIRVDAVPASSPSSCFHQLLYSQILGGAAVVALEIARSLCDRERDARVWIPAEGAVSEKAASLGLPFEVFGLPPLQSRWKLRAGVANWRVGRRLRRGGPGLAHFHSPFLYGLLRVGTRLSGLRSVVHVHFEEEEEMLRWAFKRPPDRIITCAMFLVPLVRSALPERWRDRQRITAIPNAVDTERFHPGDRRAEKARLGLDPDVPLILMLANLAPHKGQETAIGAAAELARRGIRHRLWMAGSERRSDSYTRRLRQIIAEAGVGSSVDLLGQRDDAPDLLRAADVLILPSSREGLPLCILEAQASRVPVLAAPVSGVPEIIQDGETGFLVPAGDARGYADRLELLLGRREIQERIADQAFRRIRDQHGWTAYLRAVIAEYEGLEDGSHGP